MLPLPARTPGSPGPPPAVERRLRTSSYTIFIDLPAERGDVLLVHGYTGAFDRVSQSVGSYLRALESHGPARPLYGEWSQEPTVARADVLEPSADVVARLKRRGYLTELSREEEEDLLIRVANRLHEMASRQPNYIFMPTYDCNLRCFYCFQDHMRTDGNFRHLLRPMTRATVDRIFTGMVNIEELHGLHPEDVEKRSIGFFGGEPLLAQNHDVVGYIMGRARGLGPAECWAVTNGTDLDAYTDLLGPGKLTRLQITLDGTPTEHDQRRIYADGTGSFERIARNISMALELEVSVDIRLNIDRNNIDQLPELAGEMMRRGWPQFRRWSCYTAPIHAVNPKTDRKNSFTSWELDQELERRRALNADLRIIDRPDDSLKERAYGIFTNQGAPLHRAQFCGAHSSMYIFDAFGDIYACWERTGDRNIRIGTIEPDGEVTLNQWVLKSWRNRSVANNPSCRRCKYSLNCGGGCAVLAEGRRGSITANFCDGYAARFRSMVAEAYLEHDAGVVHTSRGDRVCDL